MPHTSWMLGNSAKSGGQSGVRSKLCRWTERFKSWLVHLHCATSSALLGLLNFSVSVSPSMEWG